MGQYSIGASSCILEWRESGGTIALDLWPGNFIMNNARSPDRVTSSIIFRAYFERNLQAGAAENTR
jgi:hypothetical protein